MKSSLSRSQNDRNVSTMLRLREAPPTQPQNQRLRRDAICPLSDVPTTPAFCLSLIGRHFQTSTQPSHRTRLSWFLRYCERPLG
ncbi:hypothetical protein VTI74DRAFT_4249 [Chaetomium olivicolor]